MKHTVSVVRTQCVLIEVTTESEKYAYDTAKTVAITDGESLPWVTTSIDALIDGKISE